MTEVMERSSEIHGNRWISLLRVSVPGVMNSAYVYSHETRCHGRIVALLPFRVDPGSGGVEFLVRSEITPCWGFEPKLSSITGGWEGGDIEEDALRELEEEAGYVVEREHLLPLGTAFASKSADTVYSLFTVDLTGREQHEAAGDGSALEGVASTKWVSQFDLIDIQDPQVSVMMLRAVGMEVF